MMRAVQCPLAESEIAPELTRHGLPLGKCEAYNRVCDQFYRNSKPSFARSSATMSASVRDQMPKPSCVSCQLGSPTITRFTRTRFSDIVHPVSSSQLTQDPDCVRRSGGYNSKLFTVL